MDIYNKRVVSQIIDNFPRIPSILNLRRVRYVFNNLQKVKIKIDFPILCSLTISLFIQISKIVD